MSRLLPSHPRTSRFPALPTLAALAALAALLASVVLPRTLEAQGVPDSVAADAALARARRLAGEGDLATARLLLDSLSRTQDPGGPRLAEVLYWRATYAGSAADAERDYRRLVVEHPASPRSEDALLRLAQLELARGDQQMALRHLDRLVQEHPGSPNRARASYWKGRALLEAGDVPKACGALGDAISYSAATDVELRNQVKYSGQRCPRGWDAARPNVAAVPAGTPTPPVSAPAAAPTTAPTVAPADTARPRLTSGDTAARTDTTTRPAQTPTRTDVAAQRDSLRARPEEAPNTSVAQGRPAPVTTPVAPATSAPARRDSVVRRDSAVRGGPPPNTNVPLSTAAPVTTPPRPTSSARTTYAVQLAAYGTRAEAEALVRRLKARGVEARVSGEVKPFRVRVGRFATRAEAARELAALKAKGHAGFVADEPAGEGTR